MKQSIYLLTENELTQYIFIHIDFQTQFLRLGYWGTSHDLVICKESHVNIHLRSY